MMRVNHEYGRGGALAYLAAYDVHQARVFGLCFESTGIAPFTDLVDEVRRNLLLGHSTQSRHA